MRGHRCQHAATSGYPVRRRQGVLSGRGRTPFTCRGANAFISSEAFYGTLFHELSHSTGHEDRLNRKTLTDGTPFGSPTYSREELVAEMGAAFLCAMAGIEDPTIQNSASYIHSWLRFLKTDPKALVIAGAQAQKASDFILGLGGSRTGRGTRGNGGGCGLKLNTGLGPRPLL